MSTSGDAIPPNDQPSKPDQAADANAASDGSGDVQMQASEVEEPKEPELDSEILNASAEEYIAINYAIVHA